MFTQVFLCGHYVSSPTAGGHVIETIFNQHACPDAHCTATDPDWFYEQFAPYEESDFKYISLLEGELHDLVETTTRDVELFNTSLDPGVPRGYYALGPAQIGEVLFASEDERLAEIVKYLASTPSCHKMLTYMYTFAMEDQPRPFFEYCKAAAFQDLELAKSRYDALHDTITRIITEQTILAVPNSSEHSEPNFGREEPRLRLAGTAGQTLLASPISKGSICKASNLVRRTSQEIDPLEDWLKQEERDFRRELLRCASTDKRVPKRPAKTRLRVVTPLNKKLARFPSTIRSPVRRDRKLSPLGASFLFHGDAGVRTDKRVMPVFSGLKLKAGWSGDWYHLTPR